MAKNNNRSFDSIFSILENKDMVKISNLISVNRSKNVLIKDNTIVTNLFFDGLVKSDSEDNCQNIHINFHSEMSADKIERALFNIEYLDKFIFECNKQGVCPIFRYYGLFSHLSTLRRETDYSEYNQLVLQEKKLFEQMLSLNYKIKLIISLDIPIIITKWGYSIEETKNRIANLFDNVDKLTKDRNIELVIDERNSMEGMYILDHCLLIKAINIDPIKKYSMTKYETNPYEIGNAVKSFDERFAYCKFINSVQRKTFDADSYSSFIKKIVELNMEKYYTIMNKEIDRNG